MAMGWYCYYYDAIYPGVVMPKTRRQYAGGAVASTLSSSVAASSVTTFNISSATGWPSSAGVPLFVVVSPQTSSEEKMSVTISGTTLTVVSRGVDGTTAASHSSGATIYPVFTATDADEANELTAKYATQGSIVYQGASTFAELGLGTSGYPLVAGASAPAYSQLTATGIADGAVTSAKILNNTIVEGDIADGAITSAKILNNTIVLADLATALQAFLVPVGTIAMWGGSSAPTGWLLCDGTSTSGYTTLAGIVGATTPDMRGRFPIGDNSTLTLLGTGGSLTIAEGNLPSHSHTFSATSGAMNQNATLSHGVNDAGHNHGGVTETQNIAHIHYNAAEGTTATSHTHNDSGNAGSINVGTGQTTGTDTTDGMVSGENHSHVINSANAGITVNNHDVSHTHSVSGTTGTVGSGTAYYPPHLVVNYIIKHD
jgi:microcystin-dependent protein